MIEPAAYSEEMRRRMHAEAVVKSLRRHLSDAEPDLTAMRMEIMQHAAVCKVNNWDYMREDAS